jgi:hypothetical protein
MSQPRDLRAQLLFILDDHFASREGNLWHTPGTDIYEMFPADTTGKVQLHMNYTSLRNATLEIAAAAEAAAAAGRPFYMLETGSSRWGTNSTELFDKYVCCIGDDAYLWSVDIHQPTISALALTLSARTTMVCDDSVQFLKRWVAEHPGERADFVYLDSWDVDWRAPAAAVEHGLREFKAVEPALGPGSILLIDDTPANPYWTDSRDCEHYSHVCGMYNTMGYLPGKGSDIARELSSSARFTLLHHMYQIMWRCNAAVA